MTLASIGRTISRVLSLVPSATAHSDGWPAPFSGIDSGAARAEGWDVFDCGLRDDGSPRIELQHLASPDPGCPRFAADEAAWKHVTVRAGAGSALHRGALRAIDSTERTLIEAWCSGEDVEF